MSHPDKQFSDWVRLGWRYITSWDKSNVVKVADNMKNKAQKNPDTKEGLESLVIPFTNPTPNPNTSFLSKSPISKSTLTNIAGLFGTGFVTIVGFIFATYGLAKVYIYMVLMMFSFLFMLTVVFCKKTRVCSLMIDASKGSSLQSMLHSSKNITVSLVSRVATQVPGLGDYVPPEVIPPKPTWKTAAEESVKLWTRPFLKLMKWSASLFLKSLRFATGRIFSNIKNLSSVFGPSQPK